MKWAIGLISIIILALPPMARAFPDGPASSEGDRTHEMDFDNYAAQYDNKTWEETKTPAAPETPSTPPADKTTPPASEEEKEETPPAEEPPTDGEPPKDGEEPKIKLADGSEVTQSEIDSWREAHGKAQQQTAQAELTTLRQQMELQKQQMQFIIQNPQQLDVIRQQLGMAPPQPATIDPIGQSDQWKYVRTKEYIQAGWTDAKAISENVDRDHKDQMVTAMMQRDSERQQQFVQLQQEQRLQAEARQIGERLEPLYKKYPRANTPENRDLVNSILIAEVHKGNTNPDFESAVKKVHNLQPAIIGKYVADKKALARGTSGIDKGGSGRGPARQSAVDKLSDTVDSIGAYAEMKIAGKV